jgi:hypothetical protein
MKRIDPIHEQLRKRWPVALPNVLLAYLIMFSTQTSAQIQTDVPALKDVYANDFKIGVSCRTGMLVFLLIPTCLVSQPLNTLSEENSLDFI